MYSQHQAASESWEVRLVAESGLGSSTWDAWHLDCSLNLEKWNISNWSNCIWRHWACTKCLSKRCKAQCLQSVCSLMFEILINVWQQSSQVRVCLICLNCPSDLPQDYSQSTQAGKIFQTTHSHSNYEPLTLQFSENTCSSISCAMYPGDPPWYLTDDADISDERVSGHNITYPGKILSGQSGDINVR